MTGGYRTGRSVRTVTGRSALAIETLAAAVVLGSCGGGSEGSSPAPSAMPPGGTAVPVSVVIADDKLTATVSKLSAAKGAVLQIRNTTKQAAEVTVKSNGQEIGSSQPQAGASTAIVIQRLPPGRLRVQAGRRSATIEVVSPDAGPSAAPTEEGGDENGNTVDLRVTVTPRGIALARKTVPAFLKLNIDLRSQLPTATTASFKAKGVTAVVNLPMRGNTLVPLDGLKPGRLRIEAAAQKATVKIRR